jgi:hypothetical protein
LRFTLRGARVAGLVSSPEATAPPWVFLFSRTALRRRRPDFISVEVALRPCVPELARKRTASRRGSSLSHTALRRPRRGSCFFLLVRWGSVPPPGCVLVLPPALGFVSSDFANHPASAPPFVFLPFPQARRHVLLFSTREGSAPPPSDVLFREILWLIFAHPICSSYCQLS